MIFKKVLRSITSLLGKVNTFLQGSLGAITSITLNRTMRLISSIGIYLKATYRALRWG
jgi:hypothetical protein